MLSETTNATLYNGPLGSGKSGIWSKGSVGPSREWSSAAVVYLVSSGATEISDGRA